MVRLIRFCFKKDMYLALKKLISMSKANATSYSIKMENGMIRVVKDPFVVVKATKKNGLYVSKVILQLRALQL